MQNISHLDKHNQPKMVDISAKPVSNRTAIARAILSISHKLSEQIEQQTLDKKGDPYQIAKIAGIMAAKQTSSLIPLCHPLPIYKIDLNIKHIHEKALINLECQVKSTSKTGVEMEALVGVNIAALTFYDMIKSVDPKAIIIKIGVYKKNGGKNKDYINSDLAW
ncbi:MAG: cyclic pyranopterin monophosphate synthase MoaC [SAR324 cluster bacterium]|nr:cyclic pyranopterin monophosphate synthase MoaC [SAR324 cluster bacterium]